MSLVIIYEAYNCTVKNLHELANWMARKQRQGQYPLVRMGDKVICESVYPLEVGDGRHKAEHSLESSMRFGLGRLQG